MQAASSGCGRWVISGGYLCRLMEGIRITCHTTGGKHHQTHRYMCLHCTSLEIGGERGVNQVLMCLWVTYSTTDQTHHRHTM